MKSVLIAAEILIILLIGIFLIFIYSGWYNVAASVGHYDFVRWVLTTTTEHSVRRHAGGIQPPSLENFDPRQGLKIFDGMCVVCHGAPGVERSAIGKGIVPKPPDLAEAVPEWTPGELFWIVSNGIKMSGMPAFGSTHSEEDLWSLVAFLRRLPRITPEEYQTMSASLRQETGGGGHPPGQAPGAFSPTGSGGR